VDELVGEVGRLAGVDGSGPRLVGLALEGSTGGTSLGGLLEWRQPWPAEGAGRCEAVPQC
jgi:hypothetical protein